MDSTRRRRNYKLTLDDISEALCNDEDSDVDEISSDGDIDVVISDYGTVQEDENHIESTPVDVPEPAPERGSTRGRVHRVARRCGRRSGRPARSSLGRSSTRNLRELDEAIGWDYTPREQPPVRPIFQWRQQPLETNEMAFCHRGNMTACKWKDKRDVFFLTTKHAASWTEVTVKAKGGPTKKIKPDCVFDYNIHKIGVDLNDQYVSYYSLYRKSMKWWKKMFFHLLARSMVNAYILYNKSRSSQRGKLKFSQFLNTCGEGLLEIGLLDSQAAGTSGQSHGPHLTGKSTRLEGRHFHRRIPATASNKNVTRVCKVCADTTKKLTGKRGRKETSFYCPDCNIPLCHYPCFEKYHTQKDYTV